MRTTLQAVGIFTCVAFILAQRLISAEPEASVKQQIDKVIATVGGEEKLLTLFRFRELVLITSTPTPLDKAEMGNRTSVVQVGGDW